MGRQGVWRTIVCLCLFAWAHGGSADGMPPESVTSLTQATGLTAVWANEGGDKVTREELRASRHPGRVTNSVWDNQTIRLFGARNEVLGFNLILEAANGRVPGLSLRFERLETSSGERLTSRAAQGNEVFDYSGRNIELFYVRYLEIKGLSAGLAYETYDERHIPLRCRLSPERRASGKASWADRPCHNLLYPEIAVPLAQGEVFDVPGKTNQSIWVDLYIPRTQKPGRYKGEIQILRTGRGVFKLPIELEVLDFQLPDTPHLKTMVAISRENIQRRYLGDPYPHLASKAHRLGQKIIDRHFQMAHRHKLSLVDEYTPLPRMDETWLRRLDGRLFTPDFGYAGPGQGVGNNVYAIGLYSSWPWKGEGEQAMWKNSDRWVRWFTGHHLDKVTDYFLYLIDESTDYQAIERWARWIKDNPGPGKRLLSLASIDLAAALRYTPSLSVPIFPVAFVAPQPLQRAAKRVDQSSSKRFWAYGGRRPLSGSFALEDEGVALRDLAWVQYKLGIERWFYWESTYYRRDQCPEVQGSRETPLFSQAQTFGCRCADNATNVTARCEAYTGDSLGESGDNYYNGDGVLFYPGTDRVYPEQSLDLLGPIASLRLKLWRRGIQDGDYLLLASQVAGEKVKKIVARMVPKALWEYGVASEKDPTWKRTPISWSIDPDDWEVARRELADIILAGKPASGVAY